MNIGILGGDLRQIHLYELLNSKKRHIDILYNRITKKECKAYDVIIMPLPISKDGVHLFAPFSEEKPLLENIFKENKQAYFLGGSISNETLEKAARQNVRIVDYYLDEMLLEKNAKLTSDGAVELLKNDLNTTIKVLIIGFGRIGKALCKELNDMSVNFCITARKQSDYSKMEALGYQWTETGKIKEVINDYNIVINTVPSLVLSEEELKNCKPDCKILDLASAPYGTDFNFCDKKHITYNIAPGIPGKYYPKEAATAIYETIKKLL